METQTTTPVDVSKVMGVYSGKQGCHCGCKGKHRYASARAAEASKSRGYPVMVSDRSVQIMVTKINDQMASGAMVMMGEGGQYVTVDIGERVITVYFE